MLVNIHFNNLNAKNVVDLYLYHRLRWFAKTNGGSFKGFCFSKTERYDILPRLIKNGWVYGEKVVKHRKLVSSYKCNSYSTHITEYDLSSIDSFKSFVLSSCEAYIIRNRKKKSEDYWDIKRGGRYKDVSKKNENSSSGFICNNQLSKLMSLSSRSISRWRSVSNALSYNTYELFAEVNTPSIKDGYQVTVIDHRKDKSENFSFSKTVTVVVTSKKPNKGFFSKFYRGFVKYDLKVTTSLKLFTNKYSYINKNVQQLQ